jgi:hypothetical protein
VTDLGKLYASLSAPTHQEATTARIFAVLPIDQLPSYFVARAVNDNPALLIETSPQRRSPISLQNLTITFDTQCVLRFADKLHNTTAIVVECVSQDALLRDYFLTIGGHLIKRLGLTPTANEVASAIDALVSLFQRLSRPPRREAQGLFGELIVIDAAFDVAALIDAWHTDPLDRFDFTFGNARLEIKTSATRQRCHDFTFEQCTPPLETSAMVVSMFVETAGGGLSLGALITRIENKPDLIIKLHSVVADTLGMTLLQALDLRFDEQLANATIAFYDLSLIPAVRGSLPPQVSAVRFRSEIGALKPLPLQEIARLVPGVAWTRSFATRNRSH